MSDRVDWVKMAEGMDEAMRPFMDQLRKATESFAPKTPADTEPPVRAHVLREAEKLVCGDREDQYGSPQVNLQRIANYWNTYLDDVDGPLEPRDIALMMVLMKVAREANGHKIDSMVDIAGYAAIGAEAA